uniref:DUF4326 domain-containing protein n=1 Tax=viral metagenome TaxID=1070528 RepID=A0A6M3LIG7_9ZZZZ
MKVINLHKEKYDVYIGRGSMFGNPYPLTHSNTRKIVIDLYREWFYNQLKYPEFKAAVEKLRDVDTLGCYCKPLPCHGDIIVEYLENTSPEVKE